MIGVAFGMFHSSVRNDNARRLATRFEREPSITHSLNHTVGGPWRRLLKSLDRQLRPSAPCHRAPPPQTCPSQNFEVSLAPKLLRSFLKIEANRGETSQITF